MPRRPAQSTLTSGQAEYVVYRMLDERRISPAEIDRYVSGMQHEIREIEERLVRLRAAAGGAQPTADRAPTRDRLGFPPGRKRRQYSAIAKEKGREAAIKEMESVLGK